MSDPAAKPPTILVIDDDAEIRYSLTRVLSSRRYQVTEAASGEQGIAMVKKGPLPDLVFLDVRMLHAAGVLHSQVNKPEGYLTSVCNLRG